MMERRDLLKDQIEQLGKVLATLLANFMGLKAQGQVLKGIAITNEQFREQLDIDIEELTLMDKSELLNYLRERNLHAEHLETLSKYLQEVGESIVETDLPEAKRKLSTAAILLDIADEISQTASFERMATRNAIADVLSHHP